MADAQITVVGNLTRDPELRFAATGTPILTLGLAVNYRRQNKQTQEWEEETSFVDITMFGTLAENVAESVVKGQRVIASGRLQVRTYDRRDGAKGTAVEVICDEVGPSLKWATAVVTRTSGGGGRPAAQPQPETVPVGSAYAADEESF